MKPRTKKLTAVSTIAIGAVVSLASLMPGTFTEEVLQNSFLKGLTEKLNEYNTRIPQDKVYLQFDKPFYKPGETIWFSAYVKDGSNLKASDKSEILYAELIDPKGNVSKKLNLIAKGGKANGDFDISENMMGGLYKVKAYTNWQKNSDSFFEKEITVQKVVLPNLKMKLDFHKKAYGPGDKVIAELSFNTLENQPLVDKEFKYVAMLDGEKVANKAFTTNGKGEAYVKIELPKDLKTNDGLFNAMIEHDGKTESISRSIPITLGDIDLSFYPEGGDLVEGLSTNIAFKALNEFGKPADIKGQVLDQFGKEVADFGSYHNGMGSFEFTPEVGMDYTVKITNPVNISKEYKLPSSLRRGWVMNVENEGKDELNVIVNSTENEEMSLMCQVAGKPYFSRAISVTRGSNEFSVPLDKFPIGVAQITLFDSRNIERAERLTFVNNHKQMKIEVATNKEKYQPREKVEMTIKVSDERGLPIPANLSLSVVDDKLLSFADDKSSNILSYLLVESDIKGKVEEPNFYFDPKEEKAEKALENLLLTAGWRRYTWKQVQSDTYPVATYQGEKTQIAGIVYDDASAPLAGATITLEGKKYKTDDDGKFIIKEHSLYQPAYAQVEANGYQTTSMYINTYRNNYYQYMYKPYKYKYRSRAVGNRAMAPAGGAIVDMVEENEKDMGVELIAVEMEPANKQQVDQLKRVENKNLPAKPLPVQEQKADKKELAKDLDDVATGEVQGKVAAFAWEDETGMDMELAEKRAEPQIAYYRAKEFPVVDYKSQQQAEVRTDFRSTIYWDGDIEVGNNGIAKVEFYNSDEVTAFRATVEGVGVGMVGRTEKTYYTQLPFSMFAKAPAQVVFQDIVSVPVTLKNNTGKTVTGSLSIKTPAGFEAINLPSTNQTLAANSAKTLYLNYKVLNQPGKDNLEIAFNAGGLKDAFQQPISIGSKGFPVSVSFSGQELNSEYSVNISDMVDGSLTASLTAYPNVVNDLMSGIESIIREPSGCFEQTSMSNYPNIMAMNYMEETGFDDDALLASIDGKLDRGYKKLTSYETKEKGYEWFGSAPGHEALTAYGLMQFNDMKTVYGDVSNQMVDRTAAWIMSRKDGKGGFKKNPKALDQFGRASDEVTNGYIVYALSEAGYQNQVKKETDAALEVASKSSDGYLQAMAANTLYNIGETKRGDEMIKSLLKQQQADGSFKSDHSITRSGGKSLQIETTGITVLAMLKQEKTNQAALTKAVKFLVRSRGSYGGFGSTQGTVLALKALTEYAKASKKTEEGGTLECYVDGKLVASQNYEVGHKGEIIFAGLEKHIKEGKRDIKVAYKGTKTALPYTVAINYNTTLPQSAEECNIEIESNLAEKSCKVGETVRLTTTVANRQDKGMPMTMGVVGIPSGLSAQPWQLKELQEKGKIGFYEITDNFVIFYFRDMAPNASHTINLDLKAEVPGEYEAPASCGYLYYTNEHKCWASTGKIEIKK